MYIWGGAEPAKGQRQHVPVQHTGILGSSLTASAVPERGGRGATGLAQPVIGISSQIPAGAARLQIGQPAFLYSLQPLGSLKVFLSGKIYLKSNYEFHANRDLRCLEVQNKE